MKPLLGRNRRREIVVSKFEVSKVVVRYNSLFGNPKPKNSCFLYKRVRKKNPPRNLSSRAISFRPQKAKPRQIARKRYHKKTHNEENVVQQIRQIPICQLSSSVGKHSIPAIPQ